MKHMRLETKIYGLEPRKLDARPYSGAKSRVRSENLRPGTTKT